MSTCREGKLCGFLCSFPFVGFSPFWVSPAFGSFLSLGVMASAMSRTIDVRCHLLPSSLKGWDVAKRLVVFFRGEGYGVVSAQPFPSRMFRVTFDNDSVRAKAVFEGLGAITLDGVVCEVVCPPPPPPQRVDVLISWFPFERPEEEIANALKRYGDVRPGRYQRWPDLEGVYTGTRIIPMVVAKDIPRFLYVGKFRVKVWYRGQPVKCDICRVPGHKAADCPSKGKCFTCKEVGHRSSECSRRVDVSGTAVASQFPPCAQASEGDGSGCPVEDMEDNELDPDLEGPSYHSGSYTDNSLAALSCNNVNDLKEPAHNAIADSVSASNNLVNGNGTINAAIQTPMGDCAVNNVNAAGKLSSACNSVMPASKASYSSVVATGEAACVDSSGEASSSDESSVDSDMTCASSSRKRAASEVSSDEAGTSDSDPSMIPPSQASKTGKRAALNVPGPSGSHMPGGTADAALAAISRGPSSVVKK